MATEVAVSPARARHESRGKTRLFKLFDIRLQPGGEHQKQYAYLGEQLYCGAAEYGALPVEAEKRGIALPRIAYYAPAAEIAEHRGAEQYARDDKAQHFRQAVMPERNPDKLGKSKDEGEHRHKSNGIVYNDRKHKNTSVKIEFRFFNCYIIPPSKRKC